MELTIFVVVWLLSAAVCGYLADARGRSFGGWFLLSLVISPVFAIAMLLITTDPNASANDAGATSDTKVCPRCAETIKRAALVCRFCGHEFPEEAVPPETQSDEYEDLSGEYKGVVFKRLLNGRIEAVLRKERHIWSNISEFRASIDERLARGIKIS